MTTTLGERARAMRLRPFAAQQVFKVLLDTLARPGTIGALRVPAGVPPALLPALALADVETPVTVLEEGVPGEADTGWGEPLFAATGARRATTPEADIVIALRPVSAAEVRSLRRGSPYAPEQGARLVLAVKRLHLSAGPLRLVMSGPGVRDARTVAVTGLDASAVAAVRDANADFPAGVDLHLVGADGALVSMPRSATIQVEVPLHDGAGTQRPGGRGGP
jgi:alpha-D-ribose 1-methylphosphonate 5-triphosphate synthase subunit PhnH